MSHGKGVHHEVVGQRSQGFSKPRVVGLFTGIEAQVLQQHHIAGRHCANRGLNPRPGDLWEALDRMIQQEGQPVAYGREA